jgi:hypothetical protein
MSTEAESVGMIKRMVVYLSAELSSLDAPRSKTRILALRDLRRASYRLGRIERKARRAGGENRGSGKQ